MASPGSSDIPFSEDLLALSPVASPTCSSGCLASPHSPVPEMIQWLAAALREAEWRDALLCCAEVPRAEAGGLT